MEIVIPQNREIWRGKLFGPLPTTIKCAERHGNQVTVLEPFPCPAVDEFRAMYRHSSPNGELFERWCFETWLYLAQWMTDHNKDVIFRCDSDCLVFANMGEVYDSIGRPPFTVPTSDSFVTRETANKIADYIMSTFREGKEVERCAPHHVADIHILYPIASDLGAVNLVFGERIIDVNLFTCPKAESFEGHKSIVFHKGVPYWVHPLGESQMLTIHCWGPAKSKIAQIHAQSLLSLKSRTPIRLSIA